MPYKIYAALAEDISSGWVWVGGFEGEQRSVVRLRNDRTRKTVHCEALKIDKNFLAKYKQGNTLTIENESNAIVANEWYRRKLGVVNTNSDERISFREANHLIGRLMASIQHPQVVVRLATWLGLLSLVLGAIGVWLGLSAGKT